MASTSSAPVDVVGAQSTVAAAHPAHNVTGVLKALVKEAVERVVALVVNTTIPPTNIITTTTTTTTASQAPLWITTSTTIKRAVERATLSPEVLVEHVSIFFLNIQSE